MLGWVDGDSDGDSDGDRLSWGVDDAQGNFRKEIGVGTANRNLNSHINPSSL